MLELMFVVVIIGVLMAIVAPLIRDKAEKARRTATVAQIRHLEVSIRSFHLDTGGYPARLEDLLLEPEDTTINGYDGPYIENLPPDSWGRDFIYRTGVEASHNRKSFDLLSLGRDGQEDTEDDVVNWNQEPMTGAGGSSGSRRP